LRPLPDAEQAACLFGAEALGSGQERGARVVVAAGRVPGRRVKARVAASASREARTAWT
jgi:hypothetical protein